MKVSSLGKCFVVAFTLSSIVALAAGPVSKTCGDIARETPLGEILNENLAGLSINSSSGRLKELTKHHDTYYVIFTDDQAKKYYADLTVVDGQITKFDILNEKFHRIGSCQHP